ncbi:MAG TPA: phenylalanine 4-monooxygenase [Gemmatimonadales bacterium]|jgi:phenylalanine-4-hydroxylase
MSAPTLPASVSPVFTTEQDWAAYSDEEHAVWAALYRRRMDRLRSTASRRFQDGASAIGLSPDKVPDLADVNRRLDKFTGWAAVPVTGFLPARDFFACLAERRFPTTVKVRDARNLDYTPEPDIFHDVFGHVPLHADPIFADFLQRFGQRAAAASSEAEVERMARLFWFTVEFGLIREGGEVKLYGSGLISSQDDAANALSPRCEHRRFSAEAVMNQGFAIDDLQPVLFVIESFVELFKAVAE